MTGRLLDTGLKCSHLPAILRRITQTYLRESWSGRWSERRVRSVLIYTDNGL